MGSSFTIGHDIFFDFLFLYLFLINYVLMTLSVNETKTLRHTYKPL